MLFRHPAALFVRSGRHLPRALFHASPAHFALKHFKLADIGEGITECEVVKWNVKPSTPVHTFDPLCEVQSDKASVEITSPFDGIVKELFVEEGQVAKVGQDLCTIEVADDGAAAEPSPPSSDAPPSEQSESSGAGYGAPPESVQPSHPPVNADGAQHSTPTPARRPHPLDPNVSPETRAQLSSAKDVLATPSVRHYARKHGVDMSLLAPGSGKDGRIEKRDVDAFLQRGSAQSSVQQRTSALRAPETHSDKEITVELNRTRWNMWKAMEKSLAIPQFTCSTTLDLTDLHNMMPILNAHIPVQYLPPSARPSTANQVISPASFHAPPPPPDVPASAHYTRLTYLPILLKTLARTMQEWPIFRSSIASSPSPGDASAGNARPTMTIRPHSDISIALSTPTGLYTPTIQAVETQTVYALAAQLRHLAHLGRQVPCALTPNEMPRRGGTVSVSNVGGIGAVQSAAPVLVPGGGVAIVAIGRARWEWDVDRDPKGERRLKLGVSWSADHRVVEGAELAAFVEAWRSWVESPQRLIADGV
ncbi:CoA-dependent acyltransferase [Trametes punicea]|nr:CoA-dependent acyltransferase [Trametes punicea]